MQIALLGAVAFAAAVLVSAWWWARVRRMARALRWRTAELERVSGLLGAVRWWAGNAAEMQSNPRVRFELLELAALALEHENLAEVVATLRTLERTAEPDRAALLAGARGELELKRPGGAPWYPWIKWPEETGRPCLNPAVRTWWLDTLRDGAWSRAARGAGPVPVFAGGVPSA